MSGAAYAWSLAGFFLYLAGALACAVAALWLARSRGQAMPCRPSIVAALVATALWCVAIAALGVQHPLGSVAEVLRNLAWIFVLFRFFAADGRDYSLSAVRPAVVALAFVETLQLVLLTVGENYAVTPELQTLVFEVGAMFRILVSVGALVLLHNLYVGAAPTTRGVLRWPAAALAGLWAYDLNLFTVAYLSGQISGELLALRGLVAAVAAIVLVIGSNAAAVGRGLSPSRAVAFRSLSLLVIGGYFALMAVVAYALSFFGNDLSRLAQVGSVFVATLAALLWLPSRRLRGWLHVTLVKHLFQHRYDYRTEWLRFTRTMGQGGDPGEALPQRVVRAMADITDSPAGLLLAPDEDNALALAARWRWPEVAVSATPLPAGLAEAMASDGYILDLDRARRGDDTTIAFAALPAWLRGEAEAWALVPLVHFERLVGVIVLARPPLPRELDWEDFDLLKTVGRQLASYLAEKAGQEALMEAAQFDEFNRRIAFVMHDIKNLASQLSLLARNAQMHADKPEFRADMLVTLRNSADKLNALLARLGRYGGAAAGEARTVELGALANRVAARYATDGRVHVVCDGDVVVTGDSEGLEQALVHLVQNALDASDVTVPVHIDVSRDTLTGRIEVIDSGHGMSAEFVRTGLFKPFVSSKASGFGIGAFEAREMVRAMGGRLDVESREGLGTRFAISLPLHSAAGLMSGNGNRTEVA